MFHTQIQTQEMSREVLGDFGLCSLLKGNSTFVVKGGESTLH